MKTKRAFQVKQKAFFIIVKGFSVVKSCFRPKSAPLTIMGQHEEENVLYIKVETLLKLNVHKTFLCHHIKRKLINDQTAHFGFKSLRKTINKYKDLFLFLLNINKIYIYET